jgi:hypothetical protein
MPHDKGNSFYELLYTGFKARDLRPEGPESADSELRTTRIAPLRDTEGKDGAERVRSR